MTMKIVFAFAAFLACTYGDDKTCADSLNQYTADDWLDETRAGFAAFKYHLSMENITGLLTLFTDDVRLYWSGMPALVGKDAARTYFESFVNWPLVDYGNGPELLDSENPSVVYYENTLTDKEGNLLTRNKGMTVSKCVNGELKFQGDNASPNTPGPSVPNEVGA